MTVTINRGISNLTLSETQINELLDNKQIIDSILMMFINKDQTFENSQEVEFTRNDAAIFLKDYFLKNTDFEEKYIISSISKI